MKSTSAIHPAITENTEDSFVRQVPHISMCESHNALITAMLNLFHNNIIAVRSVRRYLYLALKPLRTNHKSSPIRGCGERMEAQRGSKVAL